MRNELMQKFNYSTDDKYSYLLLSEVSVDIKMECITLVLVYPEDKKKEITENRQLIIDKLAKILKSNARVDIHFRMSHFDDQFFKSRVIKFFEKYPTVAPYIYADEIFCVKTDDGHSVTINLEETVLESVFARGLHTLFFEEVRCSYCEKVSIEFVPVVVENKFDSIDAFKNEKPLYVLENEGGRYIVAQNVSEFIGKPIYQPAKYISDCTRQGADIVIAGRVGDFEERYSKPKEGFPDGKKFYKFSVTDPTGTMKCLFFPRKHQMDIMLSDIDNSEVIINGELKQNTYKNEVTLDFWVKEISYCTLPEDFKENRILMQVPEEYKCVFPKPYTATKQADFFAGDEQVAPYLLGKTFCVFDVETTGLSPINDKIIELAAVKIVDGKITESFSSFVNPHIPIQKGTTDLTGIVDADVENAPDISEVLTDFYKFSHSTILVGHNVDFDISFINSEGEPFHIVFDNKKEDTYRLAMRYVKGLKKYKLSFVAEHFGLVNERAHRALQDTIVTAEIFKRLAFNLC